MVERAAVPCNGCSACCRNDLIVLYPEDGDVVASYQTVEVTNPLTGALVRALDSKPDGSCVYLGDHGCTIHDRAPLVCRRFDCRRFVLELGDRASRRRLIREGIVTKDVVAAGVARMHTLPDRDAPLGPALRALFAQSRWTPP